VTWESLGHQGRIFIKGGPTVDQLTAFKRRAGEPSRSAPTPDSTPADGITAAAELAARELSAKAD